MARALSQIVTVIRGSVGGITFTANQWHQILLRARTAPVQPQTNAQGYIKTGFAEASDLWKNLTPVIRAQWTDYALSVTYTGPLGDYTLPGRQIFMAAVSLFGFLRNAGLISAAITTDPPIIPGRATITNINADVLGAPGTGFQVNVSNPSAEDIFVLMELSPPFNQTRLRYKGPFNFNSAIIVHLPASTSSFHAFTGLIEDLAYFVRLRGVVTAGPARLTLETFLRAVATVTVP